MTQDNHKEIHAKIDNVAKEVRNIKDNHLFHMGIDISEIKTNQKWLMKAYWVVATASIGALVAAVINLV